MKPIIKWQYVEPRLMRNKKNDNPYEEEWLKQDDEDELEEDNDKPNQIIHSPFGFLTVPQDIIIGMWVAHCNFGITEELAPLIEEADGVDIFNVFSRYRFGVVPGECFEFEHVRTKIEEIISKYFTNNDLESNLTLLKSKVSIHKYWAIYALPNGHIESIYSDDINEEYSNKFKLLKKTYDGVGGIFQSNDTI